MILHRGKFKIDIFDITVHIVICDTSEALSSCANRTIRKYKEEELTYPCKGLVFTPNEDGSKIFVYFSKEDLSYNIIGHENDHIRFLVLENSSTKDIDMEVSANIAGFITEKIFQFLDSKNLKYR